MPIYHVELARPVPIRLGQELAKRVYYLLAGIESFSLVTRDDRVVGVDITTAEPTDALALAGRLEYVSRTEVLPQRLATADPVWVSPHAPSRAAGVFEELKARGAVYEMGPGTVATSALFTDVLDALGAGIRALATSRFGAVEYRYPTVISTDALRSGGYLTSFPQFVLSASLLRVDLEVYRRFVEQILAGEEPASVIERNSAHSGYCLPPTMCFHTYLQFAGRRLPTSPTVVTSQGRSFRFESRYSRSLERLWDFTIREVVFLGEAETVARCRSEFLDAICSYVDELGLAGQVEPANDPFFGTGAVPTQVLAQRLHRLKYELRLPAEQGRDIAVASFNLHGTMFGDAYKLSLPTAHTAHTACAGVGLERLAFAFLCQHGLDRGRWPGQVRTTLGI